MDFNDLSMGQAKAVFNRLGGTEGVMALLQGRMKVEIVKHLIDFAADPFCPPGWTVIYHNPGLANYEWEPAKAKPYLSPNQQDGKWIKGWDLFWELVNRGPRFSANMIDFWIGNPDAFPKDWSVAYCWDTLYLDPFGIVCVRYVYRDGDELNSSFRWLDSYFGGGNPAVVPASF